MRIQLSISGFIGALEFARQHEALVRYSIFRAAQPRDGLGRECIEMSILVQIAGRNVHPHDLTEGDIGLRAFIASPKGDHPDDLTLEAAG